VSKLHTEKRIKAVNNITGGTEGDPVDFEDGDIVYDLTSGEFKKKSGGIGGGTWGTAVSAGSSSLSALTDVDLTGLSASDIGDQLTYSYIDASKDLAWGAGTIRITLSKTGSRGSDGNGRAIEFASGTPGAAWDGSANKLTITYNQNNADSTASIIAGLIDGIADISAAVVNSAHNNEQQGAHTNTTFAGGSEKWMSAAPGGGGGGATNLGYTAGTRELSSSTGTNVLIPLADTNNAGLMSDAQFDKLAAIDASADVTDASTVNAAGAIMHSDLGTKGDVVVGDGSGDATILGIGTDTHVLTADSNEPSGVKWAAAPGGGIANVNADSSPRLGGNLECDDGSNENTNASAVSKNIKHVNQLSFRGLNGTVYTSGVRIYNTYFAKALFIDVAYGKAERDSDLNGVIIGNKGAAGTATDEDKGVNMGRLFSADNSALYLKAAFNGAGSGIQINNGLNNGAANAAGDREGIELRLASDNSDICSVGLKPQKLNTTAGTDANKAPALRFYNHSGNYIGLKAPDATDGTASFTFTLPINDGNSGQFLKTDGNGVLSWDAAGGGGGGSSISLGDTAVTITDTGSDGNIEFKTENTARWNITSSGHLLPAANDTFDIGSADKKVRDLYVEDSSIWIGDEHKIMIQGNMMKFRRRKNASGDGNVPQSLKDAIGGSSVGVFDGVAAGAITQAWIVGGNSSAFNYVGCSPSNPSDLSQFKLQHWQKVINYVRSVDGSLLPKGMASLFSADQDFATSTDAGGADWGNITGKPTFVTSFTNLSDTPSGYASSNGDANKFVKLNADGDGIIFSSVGVPANIGDLGDVDLTGNADGKVLRWNNSQSRFEPFTENAVVAAVSVSEHPDVPTINNADQGKFVKINGGSNNFQYTTVSIADLSDVDLGGNADGKVLAWSNSNNRFEPANAGGGSVNINGSPASNQLTFWHDGSNIKGDPNLLYDSAARELTIQLNSNDFTKLKRDNEGLEVRQGYAYHQHLMIDEVGNQASTVTLSGSPTLTTDTSNTIGFATTQPTAPTKAFAWSDKYYEIDSTTEYVQIDVSSAIQPGISSKDFYFQMRTIAFDNAPVDDAMIRFYNAAGSTIELKWEVFKQDGANWVSMENNNGNGFVLFDPVPEGLVNEQVHWIKVTLEDGATGGDEDVDELGKLRFYSSASESPAEKIQYSNFFIDGEGSEPIKLHEDGYLHLQEEQGGDPAAPTAGEGGKLYAKSDGKIHYRSSAGTFDLTGGGITEVPDLSWHGGFQGNLSSAVYLPMIGLLEVTSDQEYNQKIMLKAGKITKVILRGPADLGSTVCTIRKNNVDQPSPQTQSSVDSGNPGDVGDASLRWKTEFTFGSNNSWSVGDMISIKIDPTNAFGSSGSSETIFSVLQMITI